MTLKLNPNTGLFEDIPDSPTPVTTLGDSNPVAPIVEQPLTTIPDVKTPSTVIKEVESPSPKLVESKVEPKHNLTEKQQLYVQIVDAQKEFNGESNIPVNHDYWTLLNKYRSLK